MTAQIKNCFTSRFENGYIVEMDYSQLEVIGAAIISGDKNMKQDILDGIDSHSQSASWLNPTFTYEEILAGYEAGSSFFTDLRKKAKAPRFELQYGAGASSIAKNNNINGRAAQDFIDRYYDRYSGLKAFQESVMDEVKSTLIKTGKHTTTGYPIQGGLYRSVTGRSYYFEEDIAPEWMHRKGVYTSLSPTKIKNYPMQGFATGDIVPEMLGRVSRLLQIPYFSNKMLLVGTIHDSMVFDCAPNTTESMLRRTKRVMEGVPSAMKERFGLEIDLPFNVGVDTGTSWGEMKKLDI